MRVGAQRGSWWGGRSGEGPCLVHVLLLLPQPLLLPLHQLQPSLLLLLHLPGLAQRPLPLLELLRGYLPGDGGGLSWAGGGGVGAPAVPPEPGRSAPGSCSPPPPRGAGCAGQRR